MKHTSNDQTGQLCDSDCHCCDHEPALVRLSEKTANDSPPLLVFSFDFFSLFMFPASLGLYFRLLFAVFVAVVVLFSFCPLVGEALR